MRLRTQVGLLIGASLLLGLIVAAMAALSIREAQRAAVASAGSTDVLRQARGMLVLTHETARDGHERAAQQWHSRYRQLLTALEAAGATGTEETDLPAVGGALAAMPAMFDTLVSTYAAAQSDPIARQRRELLVDLLVAETQAVLDEVSNWVDAVDAQRLASERRLALLAGLGPALMALPLVGMGWLMALRVLGPVRRLQAAMARVEAGDLHAHIDVRRGDELGDLKRAFLRMTESLQSSTERLAANEERLRLITDHLPARVYQIDLDERCGFANRAFCTTWGYEGAAEVIGRPIADLLPVALYAGLQPRLAAARRGEPQLFLLSVPGPEGVRHHDYAVVPDQAADGAVRGLYVMAREVTERVEAEARIEAALHEKEVLLKEVHHRVKNNMQVISSLLQLQSGQTQEASVRELLAESQDRIRSMALIHEKLYQNHDFARIDFADYVQGLLAVLSASHGHPARVDIRAESLWLSIDQAVPAGLVLNELVTNSFKHAFPGGSGGRIEVRFEAIDGERVRLAVADDGVGVPAGFEPAAGRSLGLRLIHILADQLDADLRFGPGPGFACELAFERQRAVNGVTHG